MTFFFFNMARSVELTMLLENAPPVFFHPHVVQNPQLWAHNQTLPEPQFLDHPPLHSLPHLGPWRREGWCPGATFTRRHAGSLAATACPERAWMWDATGAVDAQKRRICHVPDTSSVHYTTQSTGADISNFHPLVHTSSCQVNTCRPWGSCRCA